MFHNVTSFSLQHPLEESRDCLAFATEPVYASLANVLGRHDNLPTPVPPHIRDYKMFDVEIKYGLLQVIILICNKIRVFKNYLIIYTLGFSIILRRNHFISAMRGIHVST